MALSDVSLLLHTSNRPDFVGRMLDELVSGIEVAAPEIFILDGSDDERAAALKQMLAERQYPLKIQILRTPREKPLQHRFAEALPKVRTPYIALAADDDFYSLAALNKGAEFLDANPDFSTVYGHLLLFQLTDYVPYALLEHLFIHTRQNPPLRWLEADTAAQRFAEFDKNPDEPSAIGWYALQRTTVLEATVRIALEAELGNYLLEYLQIFVQSALGKSHMLDDVFLARQVNPKQQHTIFSNSTIEHQYELLEQKSAELLVMSGMHAEEAEKLATRFYEGVRAFASKAERPSLFEKAKPLARLFQRARASLIGFNPNLQEAGPGSKYPDDRLPPIPGPEVPQSLARHIAEACTAKPVNHSGGSA